MKRGELFTLSFKDQIFRISRVDRGWVDYYEVGWDRREIECISERLFHIRAHIIEESAYASRCR